MDNNNSMPSRRALLLAAAAPVFGATRDLNCDIAVIGASFGGVAAALAALRNGYTVVLTEETDWIGGQVTSQMVPPDEHQWIEQFGGTRAYRDYRNGVRAYYHRNFPLTEDARAKPFLNPGEGSVSRITHEPRVSLEVLESMLQPYISGGRLRLLLEHKPVSASVDRDRVQAVTVARGNVQRTITAKYFIDGTDQGELLPLTKTEFVTGFETGEPHGPSQPQPNNIQATTWCFAMSHHPGEDHTIDKPATYDFWKSYTPNLKPSWSGKLLSWSYSDPITLKAKTLGFDPEKPTQGVLNLWTYRRIAAKSNFRPGAYTSDICLVNWPQNDYWLTGKPEEAKQLSLSLLYWMQTDMGFKGLKLRGDVSGTEDGLAKYAYIRESRRIQAEFTVLEQHVGQEARRSLTTAEPFADSVGIGYYRIDLHPSTGGDNYIDIASMPFQIPLGSLIPKRVENLLPACKNLGTTHITNGCYRLHPVEWNIGESAGCLAAFALTRKEPPRRVRADQTLLKDFQSWIQTQGIELAWPRP
ncbi:FAD-dependent oxidoreductase [Bryobacterales bacterium F-183]|nr:FAD-dependent oxidoreductase [Bryobacterales bacterium F-183]